MNSPTPDKNGGRPAASRHPAKIRINRTTPSFDPINPAWYQQKNFTDGSFMEFGGISRHRWDRHVAYWLRSACPRSFVSVVGRCLAPQRRQPDFLAIRIGADPARYFPLTFDSTLYITVNPDLKLSVTKTTISWDDFMKEWGTHRVTMTSSAFDILP